MIKNSNNRSWTRRLRSQNHIFFIYLKSLFKPNFRVGGILQVVQPMFTTIAVNWFIFRFNLWRPFSSSIVVICHTTIMTARYEILWELANLAFDCKSSLVMLNCWKRFVYTYIMFPTCSIFSFFPFYFSLSQPYTNIVNTKVCVCVWMFATAYLRNYQDRFWRNLECR